LFIASTISSAVKGALEIAQSHMGERRVGEHAIGDQPIARVALPSGEIVSDDPKVIIWRAFPGVLLRIGRRPGREKLDVPAARARLWA
jgi:hypothetical protein